MMSATEATALQAMTIEQGKQINLLEKTIGSQQNYIVALQEQEYHDSLQTIEVLEKHVKILESYNETLERRVDYLEGRSK